MKVIVTLEEINNSPWDGWNYICNKYGLNPWCLNERLAKKSDTIEISFEDAIKIGLDKNDQKKINTQIICQRNY